VKSRLVLALLFWCTAVVFLWLPGFGNYAVDHMHYLKEGYGMLSYYSRESRGGVVGVHGVNYPNLVATLILTLLVSASLLYELRLYCRNQREKSGKGHS
jgi:hypothetical protein